MRNMEAKDVQEFFERVAVDWDTMRLAYYDERVIERMAAVSGVNEGMIVADVGPGTGFVAAGIAPRVGRVLAVDNSPAMLEVAQKVGCAKSTPISGLASKRTGRRVLP